MTGMQLKKFLYENKDIIVILILILLSGVFFGISSHKINNSGCIGCNKKKYKKIVVINTIENPTYKDKKKIKKNKKTAILLFILGCICFIICCFYIHYNKKKLEVTELEYYFLQYIAINLIIPWCIWVGDKFRVCDYNNTDDKIINECIQIIYNINRQEDKSLSIYNKRTAAIWAQIIIVVVPILIYWIWYDKFNKN